jgi:hypothetical protein
MLVTQKGFIMTFPYVLTIHCDYINPYFILPISRFHCSIFLQVYKAHRPYSLSFSRSFPTHTHPPNRTYFTSCLSFFKYILTIQKNFVLEFHMHILYFNSIHPLYYSLSPSPKPCYSTAFRAFCDPISCTDAMYFDTVHSPSFLLPLLPLPNFFK